MRALVQMRVSSWPSAWVGMRGAAACARLQSLRSRAADAGAASRIGGIGTVPVGRVETGVIKARRTCCLPAGAQPWSAAFHHQLRTGRAQPHRSVRLAVPWNPLQAAAPVPPASTPAG